MLPLEQVQRVVDIHFPEYKVLAVTELANKGFSFTKLTRTYVLDLAPPTHTSFLTLSDLSSTSTIWHPNSLATISHIIGIISSQTSIPVAASVLDTSCSVLPCHLLLTPPYRLESRSLMSLAEIKRQNNLTAEQLAFIDLNLGQLLGQLHSGVLNEWYGLPQATDPLDPSYSWQETFTLLFDYLLTEYETAPRASEIPVQEIRQYLSRAIAYFLFDDVQVPSLVWLTGYEEDIYVTLNPRDSSPHAITIAAILPNVAHAIWGDPLLEAFFMPPGPSQAIWEGYTAGGGEPLLVFPRQKTKRIWYTMFLALIVLSEHRDGGNDEKQSWALKTLNDCVVALREAQFY